MRAIFLLGLSLLGASCSFTMPEREDQVIPVNSDEHSKVETISVDEVTDAFIFTITYPKFEQEILSKLVEDTILDRKITFEQDVLLNGPTDPNTFGEHKNGFWAEYTVDTFNDSIKTITYTVSTYYAGAAHPNTEIITIIYDLEKDRQLFFEDIFLLDKDTLFALSDKIKTELYKQSADVARENGGDPIVPPDNIMIEDGAGPFADNFRNFILQKESIVFLFPPYQVGPYAEGVKEVVFPYEEVSELFLPGIIHLK